VGPVSASDVATASMTLSPMTLGDPKTQNTSYASKPNSITPAALKLLRPSSCKHHIAITTHSPRKAAEAHQIAHDYMNACTHTEDHNKMEGSMATLNICTANTVGS